MLAAVVGLAVGSRAVEAFSMEGCPEIIQAYFGERSEQACRVSWCESRWNPDAVSPTEDYGLFQVNRIHGLGWSALDPDTNVAYAYRLSDGGINWGPWRNSRGCWGS